MAEFDLHSQECDEPEHGHAAIQPLGMGVKPIPGRRRTGIVVGSIMSNSDLEGQFGDFGVAIAVTIARFTHH